MTIGRQTGSCDRSEPTPRKVYDGRHRLHRRINYAATDALHASLTRAQKQRPRSASWALRMAAERFRRR
jgi:hypothetical protein